MTQDLRDKTLVVTGAARGIEEQVARLAAGRGARVALIGLEPDRLSSLAAELGPASSFVEADVRDGAALRAAIDASAQRLGGIDHVVANAGVVVYGTVRQADEASFEQVLDVNLNGVFRTVPGAVGVTNWGEALLSSRLAWAWTRRLSARWVPTLEREVASLGRHDQRVPRGQAGTRESSQRVAASWEAAARSASSPRPVTSVTPIGSMTCRTGSSKSAKCSASSSVTNPCT